MTSPALSVLFIALVISNIGTASKRIADHDNPQSVVKSLMIPHSIQTEITPPINTPNYYNFDENNIEVYNRNNLNNEPVSLDEDFMARIFEVSKTKLSYNNNKVKKVRHFENIDRHKYNNKLFPVNKNKSKIHTKDNDRNKILAKNLVQHNINLKSLENITNMKIPIPEIRRVKRDSSQDRKCDHFKYNELDNSNKISHPHDSNTGNGTYYRNISCITVITAPEGMIIELTFVDLFHVEYHPTCAYDYLEIRDGLHGYSTLKDKVCGESFPRQMTSSGPNMWLKFHSDENIEYEGFRIIIDKKPGPSHRAPEACTKTLDGKYGFIETENIDPACKTGSAGHALDVLWKIVTPLGTKIYLNFTVFSLGKPNNCEENMVQVFGEVLEIDSMIIQYCGSMANLVGSKDEPTNVMHVRLFESRAARESGLETKLIASYTSYRTLNPNTDEKCTDKEFNCEDNTCIDSKLKCDHYEHCRLKTDEDAETCKNIEESMLNQTHILVILVIFSLILSGMTFIFLFKCIMKLYQDNKIIKEHINQSREDRLDDLVDVLTLGPHSLQSDSESRVILEREKQTNETFKQQRNLSKHKLSSIDSDFVQETQLDADDVIWRKEMESIKIDPEDSRIDRNGRTRRNDLSKKGESIRSKRKESKEREREMKEISNVSVGALDAKESGCQTRDSLFQTDPFPTSTGLGSNSRGSSTFGYSDATIARHTPPAATNTSEITIELLAQVPRQESVKPQKKLPEQRPISTETTRSAPDVIIFSKPIP